MNNYLLRPIDNKNWYSTSNDYVDFITTESYIYTYNNKWEINMDCYFFCCSTLPRDFFTANLDFTFGQIENIQLILNDKVNSCDDIILWMDKHRSGWYYKAMQNIGHVFLNKYSFNIVVDMSKTNLSTFDMLDIDLAIKAMVTPETYNRYSSSTLNLDETTFDEINDELNKTFAYTIPYVNQNINNNDQFIINSGYYINMDGEVAVIDYDELKIIENSHGEIQNNEWSFYILNLEQNIEYKSVMFIISWYYDNNWFTYQTNETNAIKKNNNNIKLYSKLSYDIARNALHIDEKNGLNYIYFPIECYGNVEIKIATTSNQEFKIKKNFSFSENKNIFNFYRMWSKQISDEEIEKYLKIKGGDYV